MQMCKKASSSFVVVVVSIPSQQQQKGRHNIFQITKSFPNFFTNNQCDKIGQFFKVLGNKFTLKSSPKRLLTFGLFRKRSINVKLLWILFRQLLKKIEQLFKSSIWSHWHGWLIFLCLSSIRFVQRFTFESRQVKILCN